MINFPKIELDDFQGIWSRGNPDEVPNSHLVDALNLRFNTLKGGFTREGTSLFSLLPTPKIPINDWFLAKRPHSSLAAIVSELIIADGIGGYYATLTGNKILTNIGGKSIVGVNLFGRSYFIPTGTGVSSLYLYDGVQTRLAAGLAVPLAPIMTSANVLAGNIPAGNRSFYCSFLTNTGFLTPPGAKLPYTNAGATKFDLNTIPIGPVGTLKRYILSTQSGGTIPYFIPLSNNGIINDNVTTSILGLNFFDTDLQTSANYLLNLLPQVPSPVAPFASFCIFFSNRLVVLQALFGGSLVGGSLALISRVGDFESFDQTSCYVNVNRDDGHYLITSFVLNNVLYFCKDLGLYATSDNGQEPSNWNVDLIDGSLSIPTKGVAYFSTNQSPIAGAVLIADKSGLLVFNGSVQRPELTWKVEAIWKRINLAAWNTLKLTIDPITKSIYCALPLDNALTPNYILFGDYSYAINVTLNSVNPMKIKWNLWKFPNNPTMIGMVDLAGDSFPVLRIGSIDNISGLIQLDQIQIKDYGNNINSFLQTAFIFPNKSKHKSQDNYVSFFEAVKYNATGPATLTFTGIGYNSNTTIQLFTKIIGSSISFDYINPFNFVSQKMSIKIESVINPLTLFSLEIYGKPMFMITPQ